MHSVDRRAWRRIVCVWVKIPQMPGVGKLFQRTDSVWCWPRCSQLWCKNLQHIKHWWWPRGIFIQRLLSYILIFTAKEKTKQNITFCLNTVWNEPDCDLWQCVAVNCASLVKPPTVVLDPVDLCYPQVFGVTLCLYVCFERSRDKTPHPLYTVTQAWVTDGRCSWMNHYQTTKTWFISPLLSIQTVCLCSSFFQGGRLLQRNLMNAALDADIWL